MDAQMLLATFQKGVQEIKARGYTEGEISQSLGLTPTYFSAVKNGKYPLTKEVYNNLVEVYKSVEQLPKKQKLSTAKTEVPHGKIVDATPFRQIDSPKKKEMQNTYAVPNTSIAQTAIVNNWQQKWPIGIPVPSEEYTTFLQSIAHLSAFEQARAVSDRVPSGHYDPTSSKQLILQTNYPLSETVYQQDSYELYTDVKLPLTIIEEIDDDDIDVKDIEKVAIEDKRYSNAKYASNSPSILGMAGKAAWLAGKGLFKFVDTLVPDYKPPTPYEETETYQREQAELKKQREIEEQAELKKQQDREEQENRRQKLEEIKQRQQKRAQKRQ